MGMAAVVDRFFGDRGTNGQQKQKRKIMKFSEKQYTWFRVGDLQIKALGGSEMGTDAVRWFFYQNFRVFSKLWRVYVRRTDSLRVPLPSPFALCYYHHCCCLFLGCVGLNYIACAAAERSARREKLARALGTGEERRGGDAVHVSVCDFDLAYAYVRAGTWILMWILERHFFSAFKS